MAGTPGFLALRAKEAQKTFSEIARGIAESETVWILSGKETEEEDTLHF